MNMRELIGRPYAIPCDPPVSYDCWELALLVRRTFDRYTPVHVDRADRSEAVLQRSIEAPPTGWRLLDAPTLHCLVLIGKKHCGVFLGGVDVIHTSKSAGVRIDTLPVLDRFDRLRFAEWGLPS